MLSAKSSLILGENKTALCREGHINKGTNWGRFDLV